MNKQVSSRFDRSMLLALTEDYSTIVIIYPESNLASIMKLKGVFTDEMEGNWYDLCYSDVLQEYVFSVAHPDEQEDLMQKTCCASLIEMFTHHKTFQGKYKTNVDGITHYFSYKIIRLSGEGEPLRLISAFKNIDRFEAKDQQRLQDLQKLDMVLETNNMGMWQLTETEEQETAMNVNPKMREIMGVEPDDPISDVELNKMLLSRVHPDDMRKFTKYHDTLKAGARAEITYRWQHPTRGERYMRCGGVLLKKEEQTCVYNGFHSDVTDQVEKEERQKLLIKSLARSYEFINYIDMVEDTFFSYMNDLQADAKLTFALMSGIASEAIQKTCDQFINEEYQGEMSLFTDLSTINIRMKHTNVLMHQFKNDKGIWYEWTYTVAKRNENGTIKNLLWSVQQIDDEKQIELRQQKQLDDQIEANKAKTLFLQNMSHEIRTPLNALFGFAQLLGYPDGSWTEEEREQFNTYIYNSYNMLDMLISDILDSADAQHGNYRINIADVSVNEVCRNSLQSVEFRRPAYVEFRFTTDLDDSYMVKSDERRIQQVLINYLTNGCKHTERGEIHLHCTRTQKPGKIMFVVTDTGHGVPAEKAEEIFGRFTKLTRHVQGSGLGLNICSMIADKLEGKVYLDTTYTGGGARFVFEINDVQ